MNPFKRNEIVILLGAGASVEAGIPHSSAMVERIEQLVNDDRGGWAEFKGIYDYVRSSIYHSDGIRGKFGDDVNYNIERLVNTLDEIRKKHEHTLYPFVGAWNPTLVEVAGKNFELVGRLRDGIVKELRDKWIVLEQVENARYYRGLLDFQREYQHPLRVFTLNYDLCVEKTCTDSETTIERGFDEKRKWDWRQFDDNPQDPKNIFLYKLHGSADWQYDDNGNLTYLDGTSLIDEAAIIFGITYKLQYVDPFLFLVYEFRRWTLDARIIVSIGYGYGDEHINGIIRQALNSDPHKLLLSVAPLNGAEETAEADERGRIAQLLDHTRREQIACCNCGARDFMKDRLRLDQLAAWLPQEDDPFRVVSDD